MKATGLIKKIDPLGRIVIPKGIRVKLGVGTDDALEFYVDGDSIVMKKAALTCCICGSEEGLTEIKEKFVCADCRELLK